MYLLQRYPEILSAYGAKELRNSYRHRGMFWKQEVLEYIDEKLSQTWSPEQIANTPCGMKMPSFKTIYRWIDERYLRSTLKNLRRKGKTRKRMGNGGRFTTGKSIRKRDKSVYSRKEFGHWEADTVVSGQRVRALGSGHGGIGAREKQSMLCHACGKKNEILYSDQDPGQERRNNGESDNLCTFRISERSGKDDYLRQRQRVCMLERNRESLKMRYVLCRPVLCLAERYEREPERTST